MASSEASRRAVPGSQAVTYKETALLATHFGVSYQAMCYRLCNLGVVNKQQLAELLPMSAQRTEFIKLLKLRDWEQKEASGVGGGERELTSQVMPLAIEAFRRGHISSAKLFDLRELLDLQISEDRLLELASE